MRKGKMYSVGKNSTCPHTASQFRSSEKQMLKWKSGCKGFTGDTSCEEKGEKKHEQVEAPSEWDAGLTLLKKMEDGCAERSSVSSSSLSRLARQEGTQAPTAH